MVVPRHKRDYLNGKYFHMLIFHDYYYYYTGFNMHIQSKLFIETYLSWALVLTWISPFIPRQKSCVWFGRRIGTFQVSCYDIHAEGALPPRITIIVRAS